jgi:hypothetical protein
LKDALGRLLFSSNWNGVKTLEQALGGGNIQIRLASPPANPGTLTPVNIVAPPETFLPLIRR